MRILIFGDSIAQGYYDLELGGWANLLFVENMQRKARRTDNSTEIFNLAVSGDTTRRVIDRLEAEARARKWEDEPIVLVCAVGVNDAAKIDGQPLLSPEKYLAELEKLYAIAQPLAQHIVFVGLATVNESESDPWIFNGGTSALSWTNQRIGQFDRVLNDFAKAKNAHFVPIFEIFKVAQSQGKILHEDGLHPNSLGHRLIFEQVRSTINTLTF